MKSLDEQLAEFFASCPPAFLDGKHEADRCLAATLFLSGIASMAAECYLTIMREGMPNLALEFKGMVNGANSEAKRHGDLAAEHHNREVKDRHSRGGDEPARVADSTPTCETHSPNGLCGRDAKYLVTPDPGREPIAACPECAEWWANRHREAKVVLIPPVPQG